MTTTPFVVGQWVRGEKFYGRTELIREILHGPRNWLWLLGTRRIGKTSLLKQIEHLTRTTPELSYFPLFWDFQGAEDPTELHMGFADALLDAEDRLADVGISLGEVEHEDLFRSLNSLRRKLRSKGLKAMLLCDEVEELIRLNQKDPALLRRLRRAVQSAEDIRSVMASTIRLWALADQRGDTSPFLHGFLPPLYIHNLDDDEARSLIVQANLPNDSRPRVDDPVVDKIRSQCDNHPYLLQLLCKRFFEEGNLDQAIEQVAGDPMLSYFFSVDFEMLSDSEQNILQIIADHDSSTSNSIQRSLTMESPSLSGSLHRLEQLGYIRRNDQERYVLVNYFFRRWFSGRPAPVAPSPADDAPQPTVRLTSQDSTLSEVVELGMFDGRYDLVRKIGRGATGVVYQAHDTMLRTDIAIKLLKTEYATNEEALERLRREIILSRDISHANIVKIHHLGQYQGRKYLTMQWIDGPTLAHEIARDAPLATTRAVFLTRRIASALEAAHACNVLHRDIKPHNILIGRNREPYLTDFGLARLLGDPGMTRHGVFLGTPDYTSPEQANLKPVDKRSDLYALGVILFEMTTGRRPFHGETTADVLELHRYAEPPHPREIRAEIPQGLADLTLRCLAKNPAERPQSATELNRALERLGVD